jgi:hypothetical protein
MCVYCGTNKYRKIYQNHYGPIPKEPNGRSYEIHHIDGDHSNNDPSNLKLVTIQEHYNIHHAQQDFGACVLIGKKMKKSPKELSKLAKMNVQIQLNKGTHPFQDKDKQRERALNQVKNGTHPWLGGEIQRRSNLNRVANGTNPFCGPEINQKMLNNGTHPLMKRSDGSSVTSDRVSNGTHPWLGPAMNQKMLDNGTHPLMKRADGSSLSKDRVKNGTHNFVGPGSNLARIASGTHPSQTKKMCLHCKKIVSLPMFSRWHGDSCKKKP